MIIMSVFIHLFHKLTEKHRHENNQNVENWMTTMNNLDINDYMQFCTPAYRPLIPFCTHRSFEKLIIFGVRIQFPLNENDLK